MNHCIWYSPAEPADVAVCQEAGLSCTVPLTVRCLHLMYVNCDHTSTQSTHGSAQCHQSTCMTGMHARAAQQALLRSLSQTCHGSACHGRVPFFSLAHTTTQVVSRLSSDPGRRLHVLVVHARPKARLCAHLPSRRLLSAPCNSTSTGPSACQT